LQSGMQNGRIEHGQQPNRRRPTQPRKVKLRAGGVVVW